MPTSWLNLSRAHRRELESIARRGPNEREARAEKARREQDRARSLAGLAAEVNRQLVITGIVTV